MKKQKKNNNKNKNKNKNKDKEVIKKKICFVELENKKS